MTAVFLDLSRSMMWRATANPECRFNTDVSTLRGSRIRRHACTPLSKPDTSTAASIAARLAAAALLAGGCDLGIHLLQRQLEETLDCGLGLQNLHGCGEASCAQGAQRVFHLGGSCRHEDRDRLAIADDDDFLAGLDSLPHLFRLLTQLADGDVVMGGPISRHSRVDNRA